MFLFVFRDKFDSEQRDKRYEFMNENQNWGEASERSKYETIDYDNEFFFKLCLHIYKYFIIIFFGPFCKRVN